jgi:MYXO-CTERM domain-containing protein
MRTLAWSIVAVVAGWLCAPAAAAFCVDKYPGQTANGCWAAVPVKYRVSNNLTDAATIAAIDAAVKTWGAVACSKLTFTKDATFPITMAFTTGTGHINIFWVTSAANWPAGVATSNYSYNYRFFNATGQLVGGHIAINAFTYTWSTTGGNASTFDVQNVVTNLVGHVIGLTDSNTAGAVMYPDVAFNQTAKRALAADDTNAITYLYPDVGCPAAPGPDPTCGTPPPPKDTGPTPAKDGGPTPGKDGQPPPQDGAVVSKDGQPAQQDTSVTPGKDSGSGKTCVSSTQCASDEVCAVEGICVRTGGGSGKGCSCTVGERGGAPAGLLLALAALPVLLLRRRRYS